MSFEGLIHLYVPSVDGVNGLKRSVFNLRKHFRITKASMVYKRFSSAHQRLQIEFVVEVKSDEDNVDLRSTQRELSLFKATILILNGVLRLDPELTLPSPELLRDPFLLKMAAEVEPFWEHRVSQDTLQGLIKNFPVTDEAELLTQGSELINLSLKGQP